MPGPIQKIFRTRVVLCTNYRDTVTPLRLLLRPNQTFVHWTEFPLMIDDLLAHLQ